MARAALSILVLASLVAAAASCSVPPQGCTAKKCAALGSLNALDLKKKPMGFWLGSWNNVDFPNEAAAKKSVTGPHINYEVFTEVGNVIPGGERSDVTTLSGCCFECAKTDGCWSYHFFEKPGTQLGKRLFAGKSLGYSKVKGYKNGVQCYLLSGGSDKSDSPRGTPFSGRKADQVKNIKAMDGSWVGGTCNGNVSVVDDPHFTGAMGTKFDFNGRLDRSFCLTTDKSLQVNVMLRGYEDVRTAGASVQSSGKALRSWIKELGLIWRAADGKQHKAHLVARNGKSQVRGDGFLARVVVDGAEVARPSNVGDMVKAEGGFQLTLVAFEKHGVFDVDHFKVKLPGLAEIDLRMRVAHPALQAADDAEAHFNVQFSQLEVTDAVHGVLGQTFRGSDEQVQKAIKFSELVAMLHKPIQADGESGKEFLEGKVEDYLTSDILEADCSFTSFSA